MQDPNLVQSIWIEADRWRPGSWDPLDENSSVVVTLADGSRWWATFVSYANVTSLVKKNRETGENLSGKYLWAGSMILVDEVTRERIQEVVGQLLAEDDFHRAFEKLEES